MTPPRKRPASRASRLFAACRVLLLAASAFFVLAYLLVAVLRMGYPYQLEWMEGAMVDHVTRVLNGRALYVAPTLDFTPLIYPPGYFYVSALAAKVLGIGFLPLRLVSFLASLGTFAVLFLFVIRETKDRVLAGVAVGLFAATFRLSGAWFDLARVDSLFLFLTLASLYLVRFHPTVRGYVAAGILMAAAVHTKQTAILVLAPAAAWAVWTRRRRGVLLLVVGGGLGLLAAYLLHATSQGWFTYYVYEVPANHALIPDKLLFWRRDIAPIGVLFLLFLSFIVRRRKRALLDPRVSFYVLAGLAMLAASCLSRLHHGGYKNVLFPAYAATALLAVLELSRIFNSGKGRRAPVNALLCVLVLGQLVYLYRNPLEQVPTKEDRTAGDAYIAVLRSYGKPVFMINHGGYYNRLLGFDTMYAAGMGVYDILRAKKGDTKVARDLFAHAESDFREQRFPVVVSSQVTLFRANLLQHYRVDRTIGYKGDAFYPVTGHRVRPELIWVPRRR